MVAIDPAGNWSQVASRSFQVDTQGPEVSFDSGPTLEAPAATATPSFGFSTSDPGATFECRIDDGSFTACSSPFQSQALAEGQHTLTVRGTDPLGNVGPLASRSVAIDLTAPVASIVRPGSRRISDRTPAFAFTARDPSAVPGAPERIRFACRIDSRRWRPCRSPLSLRPLSTGKHRLRVRATDVAGNRQRGRAEVRFPIV